MSTRSQLRFLSLILKLTAGLVFAFEVVLKTSTNLGFWLSSSTNWWQVVYIVVGSVLNGAVPMLLTYGGAKAIDLLLSIEGDMRDVAQVVRSSRRRREAAREDLAPNAPDPNRHIWNDHPGSIRDGRNLQQPTYNVFGQRIYRGKPKR